ncbi:MAG: hypothetical protein EAZ95_01455 [Bacteroidetes bacterium]|nr:MAG: hypothetical protein EAZ95_01455 [Bacteroidota bacterium]
MGRKGKMQIKAFACKEKSITKKTVHTFVHTAISFFQLDKSATLTTACLLVRSWCAYRGSYNNNL